MIGAFREIDYAIWFIFLLWLLGLSVWLRIALLFFFGVVLVKMHIGFSIAFTG